MAKAKRKTTAYSKAVKAEERRRGHMSRSERKAAIERSEKRRKRKLTLAERRKAIERAERKRGRLSKDERKELRAKVSAEQKEKRSLARSAKKVTSKITRKASSRNVLTAKETSIQATLKTINERIAKWGRQYGKDSYKYQEIVEKVKGSFQGNLKDLQFTQIVGGKQVVRTLFKVTSGGLGFDAIDTSSAIVREIIRRGFEGDVRLAKARAEKLGKYNKEIRRGLEEEARWQSGFDEDWEEIYLGPGARNQKQKDYARVRDAMRIYLDNHAYEDSDKFKDALAQELRGAKRPATYWELYRAACAVEGLDWRKLSTSTDELYGKGEDFSHRTEEDKDADSETVVDMKETKEVDLYAGKPGRPRFMR